MGAVKAVLTSIEDLDNRGNLTIDAVIKELKDIKIKNQGNTGHNYYDVLEAISWLDSYREYKYKSSFNAYTGELKWNLDSWENLQQSIIEAIGADESDEAIEALEAQADEYKEKITALLVHIPESAIDQHMKEQLYEVFD